MYTTKRYLFKYNNIVLILYFSDEKFITTNTRGGYSDPTTMTTTIVEVEIRIIFMFLSHRAN